jgi:hypothetical protein
MRTNLSRFDYRSGGWACEDHMRNGEAEHGTVVGDDQRADLEPLLRALAKWAADRPILLDVTVFGDRLRRNADPALPLTLAVRYDEQRMTEGFDDWIEQLRTGFKDLARSLGQPVEVAPPNDAAAWELIARGVEVRGLKRGKVRCVATPVLSLAAEAAAASPVPQLMGDATRAVWHRFVNALSMPVATAIAAGRRFVL